MEVDAERLPDGAQLEAALCIVGAGPAGIALARECGGRGVNVLLLESGGTESEEWPQTLNEGTVAGDSYAGLRATRRRQAGGTSVLWNTGVSGVLGAKFTPLDPCDFEVSAEAAGLGWPLARSDLEPFYRRAQRVCGLGSFQYEGAEWPGPERSPLPIGGQWLTTRIYQFGPQRLFTETYLSELRAAPAARLCYHATVCELIADGTGRRIVEARIGCRSGKRLSARAPVFVLAGGAIENARLLLVSVGRRGTGLGNQHDWVGRCFMEHPRDQSLRLVPHSPDFFREAAFYNFHRARDGTIIAGRLAPTEATIRRHRLSNFSITLLPRPGASLSARGAGWIARLGRAVRRQRGRARTVGDGWSELPEPAGRSNELHLLINLEQRPNPENRVVLGSAADALGMPRPRLQWRWRSEEQAELDRLRGLLADWLGGAVGGRVRIAGGREPDLNAHHHAGTTRMAPHARLGVVDLDCRVHGTDNLYVTGASVLPSAGVANPTLTIVALALRLADHLGSVL
ncbi:MAG TPA: GMC family oxidoreductase [Gemmatimonadales bacterium]|jgi:choline dehydrogenase-like flavoprotein|nr:GMC family oxidoreductase [Gemmatimonadales bacterium]